MDGVKIKLVNKYDKQGTVFQHDYMESKCNSKSDPDIIETAFMIFCN
jgi:hypothetical protein